jgi:hypothetical protein
MPDAKPDGGLHIHAPNDTSRSNLIHAHGHTTHTHPFYDPGLPCGPTARE